MYPTYQNDIKLIIFKKDLYIKFCYKTKQKKIENFKGLSFQNTCKIKIKIYMILK